MTPEQVQWLIEAGRQLLKAVSPPSASRSSSLLSASEANLAGQAIPPSTVSTKQWRDHRLEEWQIALLQEQIALRWRCRHRFPHPNQWLWTDRSLSQASDYWSAQFKASLFPANQPVVDACCGAGSDLVALARRGAVLGIDGDPALALLAQDNARAHGFHAEVRTAQLPEAWRVESPWLSIDPDRRTHGKTGNSKTLDAMHFSPTLPQVMAMAETCSGAVIKLAPSTRFSDSFEETLKENCQRLWLGNCGECRQQLLLTGDLRRGSNNGAVLCEPGATKSASSADTVSDDFVLYRYDAEEFNVPPITTDHIGPFLFDLHPTLHAANLQMQWGNQHGLLPLGSTHGYYTGDAICQSPWCQPFEVIDVLAWDDRKLRKWLHRNKAGLVEVKCRSLHPFTVQQDLNAYQRRYSQPQGEPFTLLLTRVGQKLRCIVGRRL